MGFHKMKNKNRYNNIFQNKILDVLSVKLEALENLAISTTNLNNVHELIQIKKIRKVV